MMKRLVFMIPFLLNFIVIAGMPAFANSAFWTYQEFMEENVEQKQKAKAFSELVRGPAQKYLDVSTPVKVAVIYPGKQASDYWRRSVSSFEARLSDMNLPYEIFPFFSEPEAKATRLQEQQIAKALQHDPDYLVFTLDVFRHQVIIERIMERGRPKLILQNITTPVKKWGKRQPFLYVGFDHGVGSEILAKRYASQYAKNSEYALFYGPRGYVSSMRGGTFKREASRLNNAKIKNSFYVGFNREKARKAAYALLSNGQSHVPFIYACSTDIALGVIDAAKELGVLNKIGVNGWGGGSRELDAILANEMDFTVMRMNDDNGVAMADAIALDMQGRSDEIPTVYSGDIILVEKGMTRDYINKLKSRAFRYSDHWQKSHWQKSHWQKSMGEVNE